ncbi:MAG: hypothetical protein QNI91_10825 [Arenicellales bacterium]|nr:hypothetical protein [Arenicellales bacterium]
MRHLIDLNKFPIDQPGHIEYQSLVDRCRRDLDTLGNYSLDGFLKPSVCEAAVNEIAPVMARESFTHKRSHNIYFLDEVPGLDPDHPALKKVQTINHTLCADQIDGQIVMQVYEYEPLVRFIADTMNKNELFLMADPLARVNVLSYRSGEALNWHFDRSEFTVTLLLQSAEGGGAFEYRPNLRADDDPNYDGVARLLEGKDPGKRVLELKPGTLNVFRGKNTAHRLTCVEGSRDRIVAVLSYYEHAGKRFSKEELIGFFGRAE